MQRAAFLEACNCISETRNSMNAFLGKQVYYVSDTTGYVYPNDESGRLGLVQAIVGAPIMESICPITLLDITTTPSVHLTEENLEFIVEILDCILKPLADFPPLKTSTQQLIESWRLKILIAYILVAEDNDFLATQEASMTYITDGESAIQCESDISDDAVDETVAVILGSVHDSRATLFASPAPQTDLLEDVDVIQENHQAASPTRP